MTMPRATLENLIERNRAHLESLSKAHFDDAQDGQSPPVVSITCSDSRVSQEGMFDVGEPGWLFTPSSIGNQVTDLVDGETVVDGSLLYPVQHTGTRTIAVVGHTGCGAIEAAYACLEGEAGELAPGIRKEVDQLAGILERAIDEGRVDAKADEPRLLAQLVEANVHAQVDLLLASDEIPEDADVYGFVYDLVGAYEGPAGRAVLVNAKGEQDVERLRGGLPDELASQADSLLV